MQEKVQGKFDLLVETNTVLLELSLPQRYSSCICQVFQDTLKQCMASSESHRYTEIVACTIHIFYKALHTT